MSRFVRCPCPSLSRFCRIAPCFDRDWSLFYPQLVTILCKYTHPSLSRFSCFCPNLSRNRIFLIVFFPFSPSETLEIRAFPSLSRFVDHYSPIGHVFWRVSPACHIIQVAIINYREFSAFHFFNILCCIFHQTQFFHTHHLKRSSFFSGPSPSRIIPSPSRF